ncbi:hypothetical protein KIW84_023113 [Lathyrus oleraceus]|uniref:Uncharacterized protein n=1 Tax=Pisum sativum TaxID=3888 RepID=A0A9D5B629_PEA|nr:hypothetical protein KIW84_023113 [Pisum sativum]
MAEQKLTFGGDNGNDEAHSKKNGELGLLQSYSCLLNHTKSWTALWMQEDGLFSAGFGFGVLNWEEKQNMMMQELGWLSYSVYADAYKMQLKKEKELSLKTSLLDDFMYYENRQKIMQDEKAKLLIRSVESPLFVQALEAPQKLAAGKPPSKYERNLKIKDDSDNLNQMSISSSEQNIQNSDVPNNKSVNEQAEKVAVHEDISSICLSLPLLYDSAMRFELSLSVWELLFVSHALPLFSLVAGFYATYVHDLLEAAYGPAFCCSRKCWLLSLIAVSHCVGLCFGIVTEFSSTGSSKCAIADLAKCRLQQVYVHTMENPMIMVWHQPSHAVNWFFGWVTCRLMVMRGCKVIVKSISLMLKTEARSHDMWCEGKSHGS